MKKLLLTLVFLLSMNIGYSQLFTKKKVLNNENFDKPTISWGYFLGVNNYDFNFDYKVDLEDIQTEKAFGFNVGLIGSLRINDYLDIRIEPGLVMSKRSLIYDPANFNETEFNQTQHQRDIKSTYIHFPLLVKISTKRVNNINKSGLTDVTIFNIDTLCVYLIYMVPWLYRV